MNIKTIEYAMEQLRLIEDDNEGITFHQKEGLDELGIYVEFRCSKNLSLSDEEIYYQAEECLDNRRRMLRINSVLK